MIYGHRCHPEGILGYGNPEHGVMLVGIAPGRNEMQAGKPFVGMSGKVLDAVLDSVSWSRDEVFCTNLICWWKDIPTPKQIAECWPRLQAEITEYKPKLVVALGALATETLTGMPFSKVRGHLHYRSDGLLVLPTYHPAAVLHARENPDIILDLVRDLDKIRLVMGWDGPQHHVFYSVVQSAKEAQCVLDSLPKDTYVSLDIETDNSEVDEIDPFSDRLLCVGVSTGHETQVFPAEVCKDLVWPPDLKWVMHFGNNDVQGLQQYLGVTLPIVEDTGLMSYSLDERQGHHRLKTLTREYLGAGFYEAKKEKYKKKMGLMPKPDLYEYNAHDAAYTVRLASVFHRRQIEDGVREMYENLLVPADNIYAQMQYRGVYIERDNLLDLAATWQPLLEDKEMYLQQLAREDGWLGDINPNSPLQVNKFLFQMLGLPGGPSTAIEVLDTLYDYHPFIEGLITYRKLSKAIATYVVGVAKQIKVDGRLHPRPMLHGTRTGRRSYRDPNMQNIPKGYERGYEWMREVRKMFAPTPGMVLLEADYAQIELWIAQAVSGDKNLLEALQSGDFHRATAAFIFGRKWEDYDSLDKGVMESERFIAKKVIYGIFYGEGAEGLSSKRKGIGRPVREAQGYLDAVLRRYSNYALWMEETKKRAIRDGELTSAFGRKRRFRMVLDHAQLRQAINFPIQSAASDYPLISAIKLWKPIREMGGWILLDIHDSLLFEIPEVSLHQAARLIQEVMEEPKIPNFPSVKVDMKTGHNWHTMEKYKC